MEEKALGLGELRVQSAKDSDICGHSLVSGQSFILPDGQHLTPLLDSTCGHLTFVEVPTLHLFAKRRHLLDAHFALTWLPESKPVRGNLWSVCRRKNLERIFDLPEEQDHIAKFFELAEKNQESDLDRRRRFRTLPIACRGFEVEWLEELKEKGLWGLFETAELTTLRLRGLDVGRVNHRTGQVFWWW